jgi:hypothetical protein
MPARQKLQPDMEQLPYMPSTHMQELDFLSTCSGKEA